jgi:tetratricopeptide (TPR) repeat protein
MSAAVLAPTPAPLESARHHHAHGDLLQAAQAYRETLQSHPQSQAALLGLSLLARQSSQLQPAFNMAQAAVAADPSSALAWANLGDTLAALGQTAQAEPIFRHALQLDPNVAAAHYGLGNCLALRNDYPAALLSFLAAAQLGPNIPEFHFAQAFAHGQLGEHPQAIAAYRRAVTLRPSFASAWLNLGVELIADGRDNLAHLCYREALVAAASNPNTQISTHLNLGHLARSRNFPQAEKHYSAALALASQSIPTSRPNPADRLAEIHVAFTYLHLEQKQFSEAWQSLHAAESADLQNKNPEIPNVRGILLLAEHSAAINPEPYTEKITQAIASFHQAEFQGHKTAASNRGNALLRIGRCEEALAAHQSAADRNPHHPGVLYNLALTQLRLGDYAHGWPNYEIRWSFREVHPHPRRFPQPRWQGKPLPENSTLLIYAEQGLGDTLQFLRYLSLVAERLPGSHLILEVQPPLTRLLATHFASTPGAAPAVIAHRDPLPHFTHHCPLMSLPAIFQTTLETVPNQIPYLHFDREPAKARTAELSTCQPTIGISWAGNPNYRADHERSTCLETFLPLLETPNIQWISLQKGDAASQIAYLPPEVSLYDGSSHDSDFASTSALVSNLDLVITTDTAVAHLAGALGKPLWLLLPWQSDWRWMQKRLTSPWYPAARLFRQSSPGNWPELILRVTAELRTLLETGSALPR